jgi:hypothetical protein
MNKGDKAKFSRKQAEQGILKDMRKILARTPFENHGKKEVREEKIDRSHVFSVIHRFTEIKRSTKIN